MSKPTKIIVLPKRKGMKFPRCDKCNKSITMFGKYLKEEGLYWYVHTTYNPITGKC